MRVLTPFKMNNFLTQDVNDPTDFEDAKLSKLDASLRCPVCKDFLDGPVNLNCGHSFCSQVRNDLHILCAYSRFIPPSAYEARCVRNRNARVAAPRRWSLI